MRGSFYCPRGREVEDCVAETELYLLNEGRTSTCIRPQGTSIVNISTLDIRARITGWRVGLEIEILYDHACLEMVLDERGTDGQSSERQATARWKKDGWDFDLFRSVLEWELQNADDGNNDREIPLERMARNLGIALQNSCDVAGERVAKGRRGRRVYWWSTELAESRRTTVNARRSGQRLRPKVGIRI